jgi:hypothetical protein
VVVLGPLRRWTPIDMFASASQLQRGPGLGRQRSWSGAISRTRTGPGRTGRTFLERREGGHAGEAVQCRTLGLSLSSGRGLERTHPFDRSHRRTCCHQEHKRIIIVILFQSFMLSGLLSYTTTHGRFSGGNPRTVLYLYLMAHGPHVSRIVVFVFDQVMSSFFTKPIMHCLQLWPKIRRRAGSGPRNRRHPINEYRYSV